RRPNTAREPLAMRAGHYPILAAMQDENRPADLPRLKPPAAHIRQVVIHHSARRSALRRHHGDAAEPGPLARKSSVIRRCEYFRVELVRREVAFQLTASRHSGAKLRLARGGHARVPI